MPTKLTIVIEHAAADYDQLTHIGLAVLDDMMQANDRGAEIRVSSYTVEDEFGCLVFRYEPMHCIDLDEQGNARSQPNKHVEQTFLNAFKARHGGMTPSEYNRSKFR